MSKPSDIPQDVFEVAVGIAHDLPTRVQPANRDFAANVIARAIMAERERCAKITGRVAAEMSGCSIDYASGFIAAAIRGEA